MLEKLNLPRRPDETNMRPTPRDPRGNNGNQNNGILSAFFPGQRGAIANQLHTGFGGGVGQWKGILGDIYSPMADSSYFMAMQRLMNQRNMRNKGDTKGGDNTFEDDPNTPQTEAYLMPWDGYRPQTRR